MKPIGDVYRVIPVREGIFEIDESGLSVFYVVIGRNRALVIDTGTGVRNPAEVVAALTDLPYDVVLTHGHVDHAGGMRYYNTVFVHPADRQPAKSLTVRDRSDYAQRMRLANVSPVTKEQIQSIAAAVPAPRLLPLRNGRRFDLGGRRLETIELPGHTDGSVCFYDEADGILFSGDSCNVMQLLDYLPQGRQVRLERWLGALERCLNQCPNVSLFCAGHGLLLPEQVQELQECGCLAAAGKIPFLLEKRHIFEAEFASYQNSCICYGPLAGLFACETGLTQD